jgi:predicted acyl esterase
MGGGDGRRNREGRLNHGGRWRSEHEWPLARTSYEWFYIHGNGELTREAPTEKDSSTSYVYDPDDPVPTIGGNLSSLVYLQGLPDDFQTSRALPNVIQSLRALPNVIQKVFLLTPLAKIGAQNQVEAADVYGAKPPYLPLSARRDVLVFQTSRLENDVEVTGPIKVELWDSSSAVDTDFTAKLIDVYPPHEDYPNGYAMNLSDSIIRGRYRDSFEKSELLEPGQVYKFRIQLYPTSNLFKKGHRIRLDISSSNWPRFDKNPNTGEPLGLNTNSIAATNTIYHDKNHQSFITLPMIPL